jgi:hypothetical protein
MSFVSAQPTELTWAAKNLQTMVAQNVAAAAPTTGVTDAGTGAADAAAAG